MADKKKRGRPRKDKEVIDTNVRVSKRTQVRIKTLATLWHTTMSDAIDRLIEAQAPQVDEVIRERERQEHAFNQKSDASQN